MANYTHIGYRRRDVHTNVYGQRPCVSHALAVAGPLSDRVIIVALCGEPVHYRRYDEIGDERPNVLSVGDLDAGRVTCKRCLRLVTA